MEIRASSRSPSGNYGNYHISKVTALRVANHGVSASKLWRCTLCAFTQVRRHCSRDPLRLHLAARRGARSAVLRHRASERDHRAHRSRSGRVRPAVADTPSRPPSPPPRSAPPRPRRPHRRGHPHPLPHPPYPPRLPPTSLLQQCSHALPPHPAFLAVLCLPPHPIPTPPPRQFFASSCLPEDRHGGMWRTFLPMRRKESTGWW